MILDDLEKHRETCTRCTLFGVCAVAAKLLQRMADATAARMAPIPKPAGQA